MKRSTGIILGIVAVLVVYAIITFNSFVKKEENVQLTWNEVQNVYQRRLELIPNLVSVVKSGAQYEKEVLESVTKARANAAGIKVNITGEGYEEQLNAQDALAQATNRMILSLERYPEIQGTKAFRDLQTQLEGTERRIKVARKDFNEAVQDYNSSVRSFPASIFARIFGFDAKSGFSSDAGAENRVDIKF